MKKGAFKKQLLQILKADERIFLVLALFFWGIYLIKTGNFSEGQGISGDGVTYVHMAKNFYYDQSPGWQGTWTAPLYSLVTALFYPLTGSFIVAAIFVSKLAGLLLPVSVYLLASTLFDAKTALISSILTIFHPHFQFMTNIAEPEMLYTTLLVFALFLLSKTFICSEKRTLYALLSGVLLSLVYLTRFEGLTVLCLPIFFFSIKALLDYRQRFNVSELKNFFFKTVLIVAMFVIISFPYWIFLKQNSGAVVLSPKLNYFLLFMKENIYSDVKKGEQNNPEIWGLDEDYRFKWQKPRGFTDLIKTLSQDWRKSGKTYLKHLKTHMPGLIPNNTGMWGYPQTFPLYFVIPAAFFLFLSFIRRKELWFQRTVLFSPFLMFFIIPIFNPGWWKYLIPYAPFLIVSSVSGIKLFTQYVNKRVILLIFLLYGLVYPAYCVSKSKNVTLPGNVVKANEIENEQMKAGKWAQKNLNIDESSTNIMITWTKLAHYLNGRWVPFPISPDPILYNYAKMKNVDYLVLEAFELKDMDIILDSFTDSPYFKPVVLYTTPTSQYSVLFLKLR